MNIVSLKDMRSMREVYFPKVLETVTLEKNCKVLDIGCAFGYFLKLCDQLGCDTYGLDISDYAISQARRETKATLYVHDANKGLSMFCDNTFGLIVLFDVIEHLDSPYLLLKETRRVLRRDGKLVITTPNLTALGRFLKKILGKEHSWYGYIDKTHKNLFTPSSLRLLSEKAGFGIMRLETPFHPLPRIMQKIANKTKLGGQIWLIGTKRDVEICAQYCPTDAQHDSKSRKFWSIHRKKEGE